MAGMSLSATPEENNAQRQKMMEFAQEVAKRNQFDEDLKRAKQPERGLGPTLARRRLEEHGVDVEGYMNNKPTDNDMKKGGKVKKMASGGKISSASKRGDGIAQRGKTRGKLI
jgi:hypothetical protein